MIQRIQTVYLLLAFLCMVMMLFFPIYSIDATAEGTTINLEFGAYGFEGAPVEGGSFPVYFAYIALALLSFLGIMLYKKRPRQLMVTRLNFIFHFLTVIGLYIFYYLGSGFAASALGQVMAVEGATISVNMGAGLYFATATIPLLFLAIRGIKRDENLVKSLDRLR